MIHSHRQGNGQQVDDQFKIVAFLFGEEAPYDYAGGDASDYYNGIPMYVQSFNSKDVF